jgi:N4-gp56 family major capsid protein
MATNTTKIADLINPQVMADMISAKIENAIVVSPFATIDTTLSGRAGDTITVPKYTYIGDATDVAEGAEATLAKLGTEESTYQVKKVMNAVELTDEAVLSGYGNPVGAVTTQLANSVASKIDADCIDVLQTADNAYTAGAVISYEGVVNAIDLFNEELNTEKVMFVNPKQVTQLRLDENFISADKYNNDVVMKGEIGMIANTRIVPSRRVAAKSGVYACPIVQLETDERTQDDVPALTIFVKRDTNVETERNTLSRTTDISIDKHYVAALTNATKVVLAKFKTTGTASA